MIGFRAVISGCRAFVMDKPCVVARQEQTAFAQSALTSCTQTAKITRDLIVAGVDAYMMQAVTAISYYKRYKMEVDLRDLPPVRLPAPFLWSAWTADLLNAHAEVLFACFHQEIDANVFASLSTRDGCQGLMTELSRKSSFLPEATWLLGDRYGPCGTVQGVRERKGLGAIQNLGVAVPHRGQGLGVALLLQALHGFRRCGLTQAMLEVTAQNETAIRLYRRVGFRRAKTVYKAVPAMPLA